jgi:hypothetical protein
VPLPASTSLELMVIMVLNKEVQCADDDVLHDGVMELASADLSTVDSLNVPRMIPCVRNKRGAENSTPDYSIFLCY